MKRRKECFLTVLPILVALAVGLFTACSEFSGTGLLGRWDLVEVQNGPSGFCQSGYVQSYPSGTVIIELKSNGTIVFNFDSGKVETFDYSIPEDQDTYRSTLPVMMIREVPFGYDIEGNSLKLHYFGIYLCDHIPATFVFKRTR